MLFTLSAVSLVHSIIFISPVLHRLSWPQGASFSALEVVPLVLLGYEAFENYTRLHSAPWMHRLKWPVYCFIAVSFWNLVGAGIFGFLINMPVSLFYIQGLNTTAVHAHTALFGVYGFLSLGFVFLIARYIRPEVEFNDKLMKFGFWALNWGLALMVLISYCQLA